MKRSPTRSRKPRTAGKPSNLKNSAKSMRGAATRRASIFQNGRNQAVRLPQDLKFPESVKEVQVKRHGDSILLSPVRPDWASFFALETEVPEDFLTQRGDAPPQSREPL